MIVLDTNVLLELMQLVFGSYIGGRLIISHGSWAYRQISAINCEYQEPAYLRIKLEWD